MGPRNRCANNVLAQRVASARNPAFDAEDGGERGVLSPCLVGNGGETGHFTHPVSKDFRLEPRVRCANYVLAQRVVSATVSKVTLQSSSFATADFQLALMSARVYSADVSFLLDAQPLKKKPLCPAKDARRAQPYTMRGRGSFPRFALFSQFTRGGVSGRRLLLHNDNALLFRNFFL